MVAAKAAVERAEVAAIAIRTMRMFMIRFLCEIPPEKRVHGDPVRVPGCAPLRDPITATWVVRAQHEEPCRRSLVTVIESSGLGLPAVTRFVLAQELPV